MEWVEVTAKTVEEAKDAALDQLGVDESEAEFEVLEEPKAGLFGRLRSEARVRARVQPTTARPKVDRGGRRRVRKERPDDTPRGSEGQRSGEPRATEPPGAAGETPIASRETSSRPQSGARARRSRGETGPTTLTEKRSAPMSDTRVDTEAGGDGGQAGADFLGGLVTAFGLNCTVAQHELDDGDTIELAVEGEDVGMLIGPRGQTLAALQELTRTVVQRKAGDGQPRILVDVAGYRKARREALERFTRDVASQVVASGVARVLEPMTPPDRKVVHDTANTMEGVSTTSEGEDPHRRVVISPVPGPG